MRTSTQAVRRPRHWGTLALCLLGLLLAGSPRPTLNRNSTPGARYKALHTSQPALIASYGKLPLSFEANQGQADPQVKFLSRGQGYSLFLTPTEAVLQLRIPTPPGQAADFGLRNANRPGFESGVRNPQLARPVTLRMRLVGANPNAEARGVEELPGKSNYFIGNDPSKWRTNVSNYAKVEYREVYPGVDVVYYGNGRQLEHDFVVAPGADPSQIRLAVEGADKMELNAQGDLVLHAGNGDVHLRKPVVYQEIDGARHEVTGSFTLAARNPQSEIRNPKSKEVGFQIAAYDVTRPLVIDPVLAYSTYLGGSGEDRGDGIAVDSAGNAYVTGWTNSTNFATAGPLQGSSGGGRDAFAAKLNAAGSALVYSTYLGGSGSDSGMGIAVDSAGNAYVTGQTGSANFPTASPLQPANRGGGDAFVAKLNPAGSALVYSTYLGGSGSDGGSGIAVDSAGNAYATGGTTSTNFPMVSPLQSASGGSTDAFVAKLNPAGSALVYSTYLGGSLYDYGHGIAVDSSGSAYVTGKTASTNFPNVGALQTGGGAFVTKLNAAGSALVYSRHLELAFARASSSEDCGTAIAVDSVGNAYVTGWTTSPTASLLLLPQWDAVVAKLNPTGSALVYVTYLGGSGQDYGYGGAVDSSGNAYVTGYTCSTDFPTASASQTGLGGGYCDAFVTKLNAAGVLVYSTYLGGSSTDVGTAIAVDSSGNAYVIGYTTSTNFPTASPLQTAAAGGGDVFITKISGLAAACTYSIAPATQAFTASAASGSVAVTASSGCTWAATSNASWITITSGSTGSGNGTVNYTVAANTSTSSRTGALTIAGQTFTVTQAGATCSYAIAPTSASATATGGTGSVTVTAPTGCTWTAASNAAWITITSGSSGNGSGTVNYSVAASTTAAARTGTATIAGQTFTVTQAGATCSYTIAPTSASLSGYGGAGSVTVTAPTGCPWTAASNAGWITITSGASGSGNGTVGYSVQANGDAGQRTGTMTIAGQTFRVTQAGAGGAGVKLIVNQTDGSQCPQMRLLASVTDLQGQPIMNLGASNFTLIEDGQTRSITATAAASGQYVISYTTGSGAAAHLVLLAVNCAGQTDSRTTTVVPCCDTREPLLDITLQPGFYIAEATGTTEGYWGMEALAQRGDLSGGFNLGGGLQEKGTTAGFGGLYLRDTQSVFIRATAQVLPGGNASDFSFCVRLLDSSRQPIGTDQCGTTVVELQRTLSLGFYVVEVRSGGSSPRATFQLGLGANYFSGGVDVGGFVAPGLTGFGALFLPADQGAQQVTIKVLGRPTYGDVGTCNLQLRLLDGNRNLIKTVP